MILHFPDFDTFRLAMTSGAVPPAVSLTSATISFDEVGHPAIEPSNSPRNLAANLKKLGVKSIKEHFGPTETITCWPQVLPITRDPLGLGYGAGGNEGKAIVPGQAPINTAGVTITSQTAVLLELLDVQQLPIIVTEMLRLGNDRQGYRWLTSENDERVLLRVIGPPYYTLLRALDQAGQSGANIRAYIERSPRVWVELGYTHPLAKQIQPPDDQMILLRSPREWVYLSNEPFQDVYQVLEFKLPDDPVLWQDAPLNSKLTVPLRLVPGNAAEVPEFWVLRHDAVKQLDTLVRDADERLMNRLAFAVAEEESGEPKIVLRVRPSKLPPPVLQLQDAVGFKPFWKLPNLFLPVGTRLAPTLRREKVRQLLADDPNKMVWLYPLTNGQFAPESLGDDAFRPLEEWIEYVIEHQRKALSNWIEATAFDFESFICPDENSGPRDGGPGKGRGKKKSDEARESGDESLPSSTGDKDASKTKRGPAPKVEDEFVVTNDSKPLNELREQRERLEKEFLNFDGLLDAPERLAIWPKLARIHNQLREVPDAAICWMNLIWEHDQPDSQWLAEWLQAEREGKSLKSVGVAELDAYLTAQSPTPSELRGLIALIVWGSQQPAMRSAIADRLPQIQRLLENNEKLIGVRAIWLAWRQLMVIAGSDVLGLARVRDRLLNRLLEEGLNAERDLPTFLRFAGLHDSERMRVVRDRALKVREVALRWNGDIEINRPYIDLMFSYGLARLGEATTAKDLLASARKGMLTKKDSTKTELDDVQSYLLKAFEYRIENALAGRSNNGPLSRELLDRLEKLDKLNRYIVDRFREQSRILEPQEKFDPYRLWKRHAEDIYKELAELPDIKEPNRLAERIRKFLRDGIREKQSTEVRLMILADSLPLSPRVGEEFTLEMLQLVPATLEANFASTDPGIIQKQSELLERSLFLAAHFDRVEQVQILSNRFISLLQSKSGKPLYEAINRLASECLRSLRKLGLRDEIHQILQHMTDLVVQGQSLPQLRAKSGSNWTDLLSTLLNVSSGWLYFGAVDQAMPFLDEARNEIFAENTVADKKLAPLDYTKLARTYATVLGQAPVELALQRIEELFRRMNRLPNTFTTATHYSRLHLNIIEDVVRAIVSEDFALGPTARRWLDDDELLVRRRVHRDMRSYLSNSGL